jgi:REP element-mobilizing transposase RayT
MERCKYYTSRRMPEPHIHAAEMPPKTAASNFMGYVKGKSSTRMQKQLGALR